MDIKKTGMSTSREQCKKVNYVKIKKKGDWRESDSEPQAAINKKQHTKQPSYGATTLNYGKRHWPKQSHNKNTQITQHTQTQQTKYGQYAERQ